MPRHGHMTLQHAQMLSLVLGQDVPHAVIAKRLKVTIACVARIITRYRAETPDESALLQRAHKRIKDGYMSRVENLICDASADPGRAKDLQAIARARADLLRGEYVASGGGARDRRDRPTPPPKDISAALAKADARAKAIRG